MHEAKKCKFVTTLLCSDNRSVKPFHLVEWSLCFQVLPSRFQTIFLSVNANTFFPGLEPQEAYDDDNTHKT